MTTFKQRMTTYITTSTAIANQLPGQLVYA